jgi:hypothetical protein
MAVNILESYDKATPALTSMKQVLEEQASIIEVLIMSVKLIS